MITVGFFLSAGHHCIENRGPCPHLPEIVPLLPPKYSPINSKTGFGNQKAYLAEISEALFLEVLELTEGPLTGITPACDADTVVMLTEDAEVQQLYQELELSDTKRANVVAARWGQGIFGAAILTLDGACVNTGVSDPRLLRASHIKPWRLCKTAAERLLANEWAFANSDVDGLGLGKGCGQVPIRHPRRVLGLSQE